MYLKKLEGKKYKVLKDMGNEPMIIELRNGKVYGGRLDECYYYDGWVIVLYHCKLLDKNNHRWIDHDIMIKFEGKLMINDMPYFWIADIKDISLLPEEHRDKLDLEDVLQIYIDPHYKPITGVQCYWKTGENWQTPKENHTPECDTRLHEALSFLLIEAEKGSFFSPKKPNEDRQRKLEESFAYIRRRLLMYGAKIP